jgi:protein phosphatase PTC7
MAMRLSKTLSLLGFSPLLQIYACRSTPLLSLLPQCSLYSTQVFSDPYTYRIAASFSAKGHRLNPKVNLFNFLPNADTTAKTKQRSASGQDAFFVSSIGTSSNVAFGVADGVGGWADSGIDSAHFSHGLCEAMARIAERTDPESTLKLRPGDLLQKGYDKVVADKSIDGGGSTACIAVGRSNGTLQVAK